MQALSMDVGPPKSEEETRALTDILCVAFDYPVDVLTPRIEKLGRENLRVVRVDGRVAGGLWLLPMGQWFGGRSVPMVGISLVGIAPEYRGRGAAAQLMKATVQSLHADGVALSTLYPATQPLYRGAGYEQAGDYYELRMPTKSIRVRDRRATVRLARDEDRPAIEAAYRTHARRSNGTLDRSEFLWQRVRDPRGHDARCYVAEVDGRIEGYLYVFNKPGKTGGFNLQLTDLVALTEPAGLGLMSFLSGHQSMAKQVRWRGHPADPILLLLAEQAHTARLDISWMVRVVDVSAALTARGYPATCNGEIHFSVRDDLIPANHGPFILEVTEGKAEVTPGGRAALELDIRALSSLYTGYMTAEALAVTGRLAGPDLDLATASAIFAGPPPWMPDMF